MRPKNKLSPYPILFNYNDDYINSSFSADIGVKQSFNDVEITLLFQLDNKEMLKLIEQKKASYVVHIESPSTSYRKVFSYFEPGSHVISINATDIKDKVEICTYIISQDELEDYYNPNFHPDYEGMKFSIHKGNILAIGSAEECIIIKNDTELENLPSIIKVGKLQDNSNGEMRVDTDKSEYIYVGLTKETYDLYYRLGKNSYKNTALSLILLPAMLIVLERMSIYKDEISNYKWFGVVSALLERNNIELNQLDITNDSILKTAQKIFSNPIGNAFDELNKIIEGR